LSFLPFLKVRGVIFLEWLVYRFLFDVAVPWGPRLSSLAAPGFLSKLHLLTLFLFYRTLSSLRRCPLNFFWFTAGRGFVDSDLVCQTLDVGLLVCPSSSFLRNALSLSLTFFGLLFPPGFHLGRHLPLLPGFSENETEKLAPNVCSHCPWSFSD